MEILNWNKLIVIPLLLIFYGCGQQTMKDEGLETKSISEVGTSSNSEDFIFVSSAPANGDSSVAVDSNITLNLFILYSNFLNFLNFLNFRNFHNFHYFLIKYRC